MEKLKVDEIIALVEDTITEKLGEFKEEITKSFDEILEKKLASFKEEKKAETKDVEELDELDEAIENAITLLKTIVKGG